MLFSEFHLTESHNLKEKTCKNNLKEKTCKKVDFRKRICQGWLGEESHV